MFLERLASRVVTAGWKRRMTMKKVKIYKKKDLMTMAKNKFKSLI